MRTGTYKVRGLRRWLGLLARQSDGRDIHYLNIGDKISATTTAVHWDICKESNNYYLLRERSCSSGGWRGLEITVWDVQKVRVVTSHVIGLKSRLRSKEMVIKLAHCLHTT